jgi:ferritin-like protein
VEQMHRDYDLGQPRHVHEYGEIIACGYGQKPDQFAIDQAIISVERGQRH